MAGPFSYFVVFGEMRTGSNYLQENLNAIDGVTCHGELFNPLFVGKRNATEMFGLTLQEREADPLRLLEAMRAQTEGLAGFRHFHDHDPRILDHCLQDRGCAKIVLTRNPVDSFVSLKIAAATDQWRLGDARKARTARVHFDAGEFAAYLDRLQAHQLHIMRQLQLTGQTAFYVAYEDIQDVEVLNGLAMFLGAEGRLEATSKKTKVQNPVALSEKVTNFDEMEAALAGVDAFGLSRTPNFEPRRGPNVPTYLAASAAPLLFLPVRGGPVAAVEAWLEALGGPLERRMNQKTLREWKRNMGDHRTFTVLAHPLERAHRAFRRHILPTGGEAFTAIRSNLVSGYGLKLPETDDALGDEDYRAAFAGFLRFLKANLRGQTSTRVDAAWASQAAILQGFADVALPDAVLRESRLAEGLAGLALELGLDAPELPESDDVESEPLMRIYDDDLEALAREVYARDYLMFGFGNWT